MQKNQKQIFLFSESNDQISRCNGVRIVRIYTKMRNQIFEYYDDSNFNCKNGAKNVLT